MATAKLSAKDLLPRIDGDPEWDSSLSILRKYVSLPDDGNADIPSADRSDMSLTLAQTAQRCSEHAYQTCTRLRFKKPSPKENYTEAGFKAAIKQGYLCAFAALMLLDIADKHDRNAVRRHLFEDTPMTPNGLVSLNELANRAVRANAANDDKNFDPAIARTLSSDSDLIIATPA